jgi:hypothetical protein
MRAFDGSMPQREDRPPAFEARAVTKIYRMGEVEVPCRTRVTVQAPLRLLQQAIG